MWGKNLRVYVIVLNCSLLKLSRAQMIHQKKRFVYICNAYYSDKPKKSHYEIYDFITFYSFGKGSFLFWNRSFVKGNVPVLGVLLLT
jgi:hypothetical protein